MTPAPVVEVCKWLDETDSSPCGGIMISHQFPIKQLMITSISMKFTSWYLENNVYAEYLIYETQFT